MHSPLVDLADLGQQGFEIVGEEGDDHLGYSVADAGDVNHDGYADVIDVVVGGNDRSASPPTIAIGCDMTGGSSGGGWIVNMKDGLGTLVSVNSYGYFSQPDAMYGPYQGNAAERLYDQASTAR